MPTSWSIAVDWELLDVGPAEERACFAALGINAQGRWLTEGQDVLANRLRLQPLLSAYYLAEWAAWNWWRLRWEPRADANEWLLSHCLSSIGSGYIWPDITIFSDGHRTALVAKATSERPQTPFRYIADFAAIVQAKEFETGLDEFFEKVLNRLESEGVRETNFHLIWTSLCEERSTPALALTRKLEALLGNDPGEANEDILEQLILEAREIGQEAVEEVAANRDRTGQVTTIDMLRDIAGSRGYDISPNDAVRLPPRSGLPRFGDVAAWRLGSEAARLLREKEYLGNEPISDRKLAELSGTTTGLLDAQNQNAPLSFAIDRSDGRGQIVLRSKWHTGRRFELARLLGDRIVMPKINKLFPATRSYTYRQKMQRAFAAELLCPFEAADEMLDGDYSPESQQDVAEHFSVSELTVRTILVSHNRIEREEIDGDFDFVKRSA